MTPNDFCYWLQGYLEIAEPKVIDEKDIQKIRDHLALVFKKETPAYALRKDFQPAGLGMGLVTYGPEGSC